jgi:hypothetical protein
MQLTYRMRWDGGTSVKFTSWAAGHSWRTGGVLAGGEGLSLRDRRHGRGREVMRQQGVQAAPLHPPHHVVGRHGGHELVLHDLK